MTPAKKLLINDHSRDIAGLRYVYPVVSRRAGGVSIGINLNPNNACNWGCVYCQVPDLKRGSAPTIDLTLLKSELEGFLDDVSTSDFYARYGVESAYQRLRDIAISGNGEPTSAAEFAAVVDVIGRIMEQHEMLGKLNLVLITNGSLLHRPSVREGVVRWHELGGEVWFKVDRATDRGLRTVNHAVISARRARENLQTSVDLCRTWVQTCLFSFQGEILSSEERRAYFDLLAGIKNTENHFKGVLLYGLARPSKQPERNSLGPVDPDWLREFVGDLRRPGIEVRVND
ncbi:MAG: radical SAM protein [Gammaproteobacteria bacterium]